MRWMNEGDKHRGQRCAIVGVFDYTSGAHIYQCLVLDLYSPPDGTTKSTYKLYAAQY